MDLSTCGQPQPAHKDSAQRTPFPSAGIRVCPQVGTYSWIPGGNYLSERSFAWRGSKNTPIPLGVGMITAPWKATIAMACFRLLHSPYSMEVMIPVRI